MTLGAKISLAKFRDRMKECTGLDHELMSEGANPLFLWNSHSGLAHHPTNSCLAEGLEQKVNILYTFKVETSTLGRLPPASSLILSKTCRLFANQFIAQEGMHAPQAHACMCHMVPTPLASTSKQPFHLPTLLPQSFELYIPVSTSSRDSAKLPYNVPVGIKAIQRQTIQRMCACKQEIHDPCQHAREEALAIPRRPPRSTFHLSCVRDNHAVADMRG